MKKASKLLSLVIGLAICFASLCTSALAASSTPEEEAVYLQNIIAEVDQFVYIDESNKFALSSLPAKYSDLAPEMKKSIDLRNAFIQQITPLGNITVNKDDKSLSSDFLTDPDGNGVYKICWWGNRVRASSEDCEKLIEDFEKLKSLTPVSKYHEDFMDKLKAIQSTDRSRIEYDSCLFNFSSYNVCWCFATNTLKVFQ